MTTLPGNWQSWGVAFTGLVTLPGFEQTLEITRTTKSYSLSFTTLWSALSDATVIPDPGVFTVGPISGTKLTHVSCKAREQAGLADVVITYGPLELDDPGFDATLSGKTPPPNIYAWDGGKEDLQVYKQSFVQGVSIGGYSDPLLGTSITYWGIKNKPAGFVSLLDPTGVVVEGPNACIISSKQTFSVGTFSVTEFGTSRLGCSVQSVLLVPGFGTSGLAATTSGSQYAWSASVDAVSGYGLVIRPNWRRISQTPGFINGFYARTSVYQYSEFGFDPSS